MTRKALLISLVVSSLLLVDGRATISPKADPKLSASFYNIWASQIDWETERWQEDLQYMKDIGIDWAFITYTSCLDTSTYTAYCWSGSKTTNATQALYKSTNSEYIQGRRNMHSPYSMHTNHTPYTTHHAPYLNHHAPYTTPSWRRRAWQVFGSSR
jgi:hypothetical protein